MRWLILLLLFSSYTYSQVFVQTFTDRCTGELKTIVIPFEGSTVVAFYNQSRVFTIDDVRSGELQVWLEEVYAWWRNISPCSVNQATTTTTQTTTTNATQNATAAASSAASSPPQTGSTTTSSSSTESSSGSTGEQATEGGGNDSGDNSGSEGDSGEGSDSDSESEDGGDDGEDSDDGEESEEEDSKSSKQKANPVIVAANVAVMSGLDGTVSFVTNIGLSQASLSGVTSDALSMMIWDNMQQFNLNLSRSYTNKEQLVILNRAGRDRIYGGDIKDMSSSSINIMYSYGAFNVSYGKSKVYLLDKGLVSGWASTAMAMKSGDDFIFMPTVIGFATKPYNFDRYSISPMLAAAVSPVMYATYDNKISYNSNVMFVIGYTGSFNLTRNFYVNLGANIIESTANLPLTWSINIGSRFQF